MDRVAKPLQVLILAGESLDVWRQDIIIETHGQCLLGILVACIWRGAIENQMRRSQLIAIVHKDFGA